MHRKQIFSMDLNISSLFCICKQNINATQLIFSCEHSIVNIINILKLHVNTCIFTRVTALREGSDGQETRQTEKTNP